MKNNVKLYKCLGTGIVASKIEKTKKNVMYNSLHTVSDQGNSWANFFLFALLKGK